MPAWIETAIAVAGVIGGLSGVTAFLQLWFERRKRAAAATLDEAEAAKAVSDAAKGLVEPLRKELLLLHQEVGTHKKRIGELENENVSMRESLSLALRRIEDLKAEIEALKAEVECWKRKYYELCDWVRGQGLSPPEGE